MYRLSETRYDKDHYALGTETLHEGKSLQAALKAVRAELHYASVVSVSTPKTGKVSARALKAVKAPQVGKYWNVTHESGERSILKLSWRT